MKRIIRRIAALLMCTTLLCTAALADTHAISRAAAVGVT